MKEKVSFLCILTLIFFCSTSLMAQRRYGEKKADKVVEDDKTAGKKEADRKAAEKKEADRKAADKKEADRKAAEKKEADRKAAEKKEADRKAAGKKEADKKANKNRLVAADKKDKKTAPSAMSSAALDMGIGLYINIGGGGTSYSYEPKWNMSGRKEKSDDFAFGGGLIFDTNLASESLFNYRLKFGGDYYKVTREEPMTLGRMNLDNIFGFGFYNTNLLRIWAGPSLGMTFIEGKRNSYRYYIGAQPSSAEFKLLTGASGAAAFVADYFPGLMKDKIKKIHYIGLNIGAVFGINFNIIEHLTLGTELGFKYGFNWGSQERYAGGLISLIHSNYKTELEKLSLHGWDLYVSVSVMYRFGNMAP